jgi:chromosome segregation ATPase
MLKKLIIVAVVGGLAVAAFKGTRWASYVRSEIKSIREEAEDQIPPEQEIARLRNEVKQLDGDAFKVVKQLARLQSDQADNDKRLKSLEERKTTVKSKLDSHAKAVRTAEDKAKAGETNALVSFEDQTFSLTVAKTRLKEIVKDYSLTEKELEQLRARMSTQQRIIDKLEQQRLVMTRMKTDLDVAIDGLEDELQALKLQQMESKYQTGTGIDGNRVAQIRESIQKQQKKFDVQRRELELLQSSDGPLPTVSGESVDEILAPVYGSKAATTKATPNVPKAD